MITVVSLSYTNRQWVVLWQMALDCENLVRQTESLLDCQLLQFQIPRMNAKFTHYSSDWFAGGHTEGSGLPEVYPPFMYNVPAWYQTVMKQMTHLN